MNAREFFDLVAKMRKAQDLYFYLKKNSANKAEIGQAFRIAKNLEGKVDDEVARVKNILANSNKMILTPET